MRNLSVLLALALLGQAAAGARSLSEVKESGELVLLAFEIPAGNFVRLAESGEFAGFDVDLLASFARTIGVDLRIRLYTSFDEMLATLLAGEGDLVGGGLSITPERAKLVRFSESYFPSAVMVVASETSRIASLGDLRGKVGATIPGSSMAERMRAMDGVSAHTVQAITQMFRAVEQRRADFVIADATTVATELPKYPGLEVQLTLPQPDYYAFALAPGGDLIEALDEHLRRLKERLALYHLVNKHFGDLGVELFRLAESLEKAPAGK